MSIRINKYLTLNNIASRRKADDLIMEGRVFINGKLAELGDHVGIGVDEVKVDNKVIGENTTTADLKEFEYYLLNKPKGVLSSVSDDRGRKTVTSLINSSSLLFPIGRLDLMSTGLILLTNDGDLAYKMTHPKFHIAKKYLVKTREIIQKDQLKKVAEGGIEIEDKVTSKTEINILNAREFEITLYEGIKRQIRMSCRAVGLHVKALERISIGELELQGLLWGEYRTPTNDELQYIYWLKQMKEIEDTKAK